MPIINRPKNHASLQLLFINSPTSHACLETLFKGSGTRCQITPQTDSHDSDSVLIHISPFFQVIDCRAPGHIGVMPGVHSPKTNTLPVAWTVYDQTCHPAFGEVRTPKILYF